MDTEHLILEKSIDNIDDLYPADLTDTELATIKFYVELTRHIQEIHQLYQAFQFNKAAMLNYYEIKSSDRIIRQQSLPIGCTDFIAINALVVNYISAGKSIVEAIECCVKNACGEAVEQYDTFRRRHTSKVYDKSFAYRLLTKLRDFAQHGHLPISVTIDNHCCFDLTQILETPHFNHNQKLENEMLHIKSKIFTEYEDVPHISFTLSIAEYTFHIISIYVSFLTFIKQPLSDSIENVEILLKTKPEIVTQHEDAWNGFVFYEYINDSLHCFNCNDCFMDTFFEYKKEAVSALREEKQAYHDIKDCFKFKK